ncbi:MAG: UbiX family flavin prenyltransferase [Bacteroidales bacterium]|nr:UbiX family flavin prenyltransferase [Bacteroidales bacterium]MCF8389623.1 UbiX family flavin prenyltransferase [Bacteroidales bacterium]
MKKRKIIIAVTGASGAIYAKLLISQLKNHTDEIEEVAFLISENAKKVWLYELKEELNLPKHFIQYKKSDFGSPIASGSSDFDTMIVCPCSMGTLARIATGISDDLLLRAADVMIKEKRRLILVPRETPMSLIHLRNMTSLAEVGVSIIPAIPSFYSNPETINELAMTVVDRVLAHSGFETDSFSWGANRDFD